MTLVKDIAVIGAGPYGLSLAAHLQCRHLDFIVVGKPMHSWRTQMPEGMLLKSPGFASNLSDPDRRFTFRRYCQSNAIPYADLDSPISLEDFCNYGDSFYRQILPEIEQYDLVELTPCPQGFALRLEGGTTLLSRKVVVAVGLRYFRSMPQPLARLPKRIASHSGDHHALERFRGREVAVLGSGASAIDLAVLLHEGGAAVTQVVRRPSLDFGPPWGAKARTVWRRLREPMSSIGPGWRSRICTGIPWAYRYCTDGFRLATVRNHLGPSGAWFLRDRAAPVPVMLCAEVVRAAECNGRARLTIADQRGDSSTVHVDHVIAATGYQHDVRRLPFLAPDMVRKISLIGTSPRLSAQFESTIPGLYFAGPIAAHSFGPVMRFVAGSDFAARRISADLARALQPRRPARQRGMPAAT